MRQAAMKCKKKIFLSLISFVLGSAVIKATVYAETNNEVTVNLKMLTEKPSSNYLYDISEINN